MDLIISIAGPLIVGVFLFVLRSMHNRLGSVEDTQKQYMPKHEVRELIEDKIGGIREDITEIKNKIDKLFEYYINDHQSRNK